MPAPQRTPGQMASADIRRRMAEIHDEALEAKGKYEDVEWLHSALDTFNDIFSRLMAYNPAEDRPEAGIMLLGEMKASFLSVFGQLSRYQEWQELAEQLEQISSEAQQADGSPDDVEG